MDNLLDILNKSVNYLDKKKIENARLTVEKIFSEILNIQRIMLYANFERILEEDELNKIRERLNLILLGEEKSVDFSFDNNNSNGVVENNIKTLLD